MAITEFGLQDIKKEIQHLNSEQVAALCLRLARYKKENKELLAYLLFEADNEAAFVEKVKAEAAGQIHQIYRLERGRD
jgi:membrane-anchored protein YejM (alkaline phosphatase superfamily)